jgi:uncharacterized protein YggE
MSENWGRPDSGGPRIELAVAVLALAFSLAVIFQTVQLWRERASMTQLFNNQEQALPDVLKLRDQVNSLAGDVAQLSQTDAAAKQVVDDMARQGIALRVPPPPAAAQ